MIELKSLCRNSQIFVHISEIEELSLSDSQQLLKLERLISPIQNCKDSKPLECLKKTTKFGPKNITHIKQA